MDVFDIEIAVTIDDHVKRGIRKRKNILTIACTKVNARQEQGFFAQLYIRRICLRCAGIFMGMMEGQQELAAASIHIQQSHVWLQIVQSDMLIVPRQVHFFRISSRNASAAPDIGWAYLAMVIKECNKGLAQKCKLLSESEKRITELDMIFKRLYSRTKQKSDESLHTEPTARRPNSRPSKHQGIYRPVYREQAY